MTGAKKFPAAPQITKSIRPKLSIVFSTADRNASGCLTSAWAGIQDRPVAFVSSSAALVSRSILFFFFLQFEIGQSSFKVFLLPTFARQSLHWPHGASGKGWSVMRKLNGRTAKQIHTIASVMARHIPDPPPVQNKTLPLNISGLNIVEESTTGATNNGGGAMKTPIRPGRSSLFRGDRVLR